MVTTNEKTELINSLNKIINAIKNDEPFAFSCMGITFTEIDGNKGMGYPHVFGSEHNLELMQESLIQINDGDFYEPLRIRFINSQKLLEAYISKS